jgi:hypothetical protein
MPKSYKTKVDVSFPRPIRLRKTPAGKDFYESEGVSYLAGDTITEDKMLPRDIERAEKGELNNLLELIAVEPKAETVPAPAKKAAAKPKTTTAKK